MKLSTLAIALISSVASLNAFAQDVRLNPVNQNIETQACYTAATEGYRAAKRLIRDNGLNVESFSASLLCNDVSLRKFADLYSKKTPSEAKGIALVAKNEDIASKACLDAVSIGAEEALAKHGLEGETIICNHKEMSVFARAYSTESVVVRPFSE
ncbi:DUF3718 domain-containing protein [Alteromonas sp. CI.11.F.A3]|uniref:DUF3718 domain-containing protein n=1 Tax=unclassified Alteromonas TaxID=2614992 RepID=UPI001B3A73DE|nr:MULTISPECIES: DUF3718 domain-containing protein [unclassified Alteromonas]MBQ4829463.1 DUF3718 domain-containing protein [Alteromonas sp. MMG017]WOI38668.1 DUF3718 domain-containing protein [Alteromonas sp. CI.11.F.A3]